MTFKLEINCDNAAFDCLEAEVGRILQDAAEQVVNGERLGTIIDTNGNGVGHFAFRGKRDE